MNYKSKGKDIRIVNLRALAILLVVFGHSVILYQNGWGLYSTDVDVPMLDLMKRWIDLIQMPLFFSLSGYLFRFTYERGISFIVLIKKKAKRLLIPFICFAFLWMLPIRLFVGYSGYIGSTAWQIAIEDIILGNDCGHLWFLQCLFLCFVLTFVMLKMLDKMRVRNVCKCIIIFVIAWICAYFFYLIPTFPGSEIFRAVAMNWIWFFCGYVFSVAGHKIEAFHTAKWLLLVVAIICSATSLLNIMPYARVAKMVLLLTCYAFVPNRTNRILELISENSFGIYLFHSPLVYITYSQIPNAAPIIIVMLNFVILGGCSLDLSVIIRRTRGKIVLGE